jgi:hypothetical protein
MTRPLPTPTKLQPWLQQLAYEQARATIAPESTLRARCETHRKQKAKACKGCGGYHFGGCS